MDAKEEIFQQVAVRNKLLKFPLSPSDFPSFSFAYLTERIDLHFHYNRSSHAESSNLRHPSFSLDCSRFHSYRRPLEQQLLYIANPLNTLAKRRTKTFDLRRSIQDHRKSSELPFQISLAVSGFKSESSLRQCNVRERIDMYTREHTIVKVSSG